MPVGLSTYAIEELRLRHGQTTQRYVDLCIVWTIEGAPILQVGGVWDRVEARWDESRSPEHARTIALSPAQHDVGRWLVEWFRCYLRQDWAGVRRAWSCLLYGGRRAGKTWLAAAALVTFAVAVSSAVVLAICTTQQGTEELHREINLLLGEGWSSLFEDDHRYVFSNGSTLQLAGSYLRTGGKQGRIDFALINEAQLAKEALYRNLRGAIADRGGMVLLTANPPDGDQGRWLEEHWLEVRQGKRAGVEFFIDNTRNPHIDREALEALSFEMDELTFDREVRGLMGLPPQEAVFYNWRSEFNVRPVPEGWIDCTAELTTKHMQRPYDDLFGHDFDRKPYLACSKLTAYRPADGSIEDAGIWITDAIIVTGDEDTAIEALLERGYEPGPRLAIVGDASGDWQDTKRRRGRSSFEYFRKAGYKIVKPDARMEKNPHRKDRESLMLALICNRRGERRLFVLPELEQVIEALCKWPRKPSTGESDRRHDFAHICDSVSYPIWRLFGRSMPKNTNARRERHRDQRAAEDA